MATSERNCHVCIFSRKSMLRLGRAVASLQPMLAARPALARLALAPARFYAKDSHGKDGKGCLIHVGFSPRTHSRLAAKTIHAAKLDEVSDFPVDVLKIEQQMKVAVEAFKGSLAKFRIGAASPCLSLIDSQTGRPYTREQLLSRDCASMPGLTPRRAACLCRRSRRSASRTRPRSFSQSSSHRFDSRT